MSVAAVSRFSPSSRSLERVPSHSAAIATGKQQSCIKTKENKRLPGSKVTQSVQIVGSKIVGSCLFLLSAP